MIMKILISLMPQPSNNVAEAYQSGQPYKIQSLQELRANLIHPKGPATVHLLSHVSDFPLSDGRVVSLCFLGGRHDYGIEKFVKVFLQLLDYILSRGQ